MCRERSGRPRPHSRVRNRFSCDCEPEFAAGENKSLVNISHCFGIRDAVPSFGIEIIATRAPEKVRTCPTLALRRPPFSPRFEVSPELMIENAHVIRDPSIDLRIRLSIHELNFYFHVSRSTAADRCSFALYRTNSWGYLRNGTFDGMIGALVRKEIDVGGSPIFFRLERAEVIDYTARTWISR